MKTRLEDRRTLTIKIPSNDAKKLRLLAVEEDREVGELIREALQSWWVSKGHDRTRGPLLNSSSESHQTPSEQET